MFIHKKEPLQPVEVKSADPAFAQKLLEQFGGATGELTASLQYFVQSFHMDDPAMKDMLQDIATEEMGHLEMVGMLIEQHTKRASANVQDTAYKSTLFSLRGKGPHFLNSQGEAWSADYINEGGNPARDLRANIAAEAGALQTYESLLAYSPDEGTTRTLRHLATREVAHTHMFMTALKSIDKLTEPLFGNLKPDETVNGYFNLSTSMDGSSKRGPWNSEPAFKFVQDPAQQKKKKGSIG
ncbi:MAG: manganese catalase family protein [Rhodomicrobium sp.]